MRPTPLRSGPLSLDDSSVPAVTTVGRYSSATDGAESDTATEQSARTFNPP